MSKPKVSAALTDFIGKRFGRLVVQDLPPEKRGYFWLLPCVCDCGKAATVSAYDLRSGHTQSCGCIQRERTIAAGLRHGHARRGKRSNEFEIWSGIVQRCTDRNCKIFHRYGGRGITVCQEWQGPLGFARFYDDMGPRPSLTHSIERKNNSLGYSKENCRWATAREQARNRRSNRMVSAFGTTRCLQEWSEMCGIERRIIQQRLDRGWTPERALTETPILGANQHRRYAKLGSRAGN